MFVHTYGDTPATPLGQDRLALVLHAHIALHAPCNQTQDQCDITLQTWTTGHGTLCDALEHLGSEPPFSWYLPSVSNGPVASVTVACRGKAAKVLVTRGKGITL